ncbi:M56 family metallopeptidase [Alloacidobacterium sp.]|uniref:M56 family metallopeptidase n=1 Tax=Alloacidobacterium sp. TaxID=2951999 RepID=UPI002D2242C3|nr:M56 family metallopeptidase [Alloacidobacterium sp.]HYK35694.1 M56 family metallopeptidase [Alloacidobacterium sp.]
MTAWILESALRSLLMAAVVWTGIKLLRVRNVAVQKTAWVLVLMAAVAMPGLAGWNLPQRHAAVIVPVQKFTPAVSVPDLGTPSETASVTTATVIPSFPETMPVQRWSFRQWKSLVAPVYLAICGALLLRLFFGLVMALRIVHRAEKTSALLEPRAQVRISADIQTPVTIGSTIVLPESHEDWDLRKLRVVIAHERSHVRQGDFYLQLLAGLYAVFFWFSPLSWWLRKELSDLGEAISDRAALDEARSRANYAEVLVEFAAIRRRPLAGVAMARSSNVRRRIDRLLVEQKFRSAFTACRWHLAAASILVPAALVLAVALVRVDAAQAMQTPAMAPVAQVAQAIAILPAPSVRAAVPSVPATIASVATPVTVQEKAAQEPVHIHEFTDDDDNSYAIVIGDSANVMGSWRSGDRFDKVKSKMHGNYIWFERDSKSYVIDDPTLVQKAREYFKPMEDLGHQQGELGEEQGRLGAEQGRLGAMQAKASAPAPDLSKEIAGVQDALQKLQQGKQVEMSQEQLAGIQARLADLEGRLGDMQGKIGEKQAEFGEQQAKLGEQQAKLGEQQAALGEQQAAASRIASQKMKSLIDGAMQQGKARQVE